MYINEFSIHIFIVINWTSDKELTSFVMFWLSAWIVTNFAFSATREMCIFDFLAEGVSLSRRVVSFSDVSPEEGRISAFVTFCKFSSCDIVIELRSTDVLSYSYTVAPFGHHMGAEITVTLNINSFSIP